MEFLIAVAHYIVNHSTELAGFILPPVVDYLNREVANANERFIVTILLCLCVAIITKWNLLMYGSPDAVLASMSMIFIESQLVFKLYFKNSWLRTQLNPLPYQKTAVEHPSVDIPPASTAP